MSHSFKAIFLSYSSDDADAARRICGALRAAGLEVWFDQSELRGGDAWDALIRKQIKECALFVPIISASTQAREEGYFRLEWKLAVDRSHLMADDKTFFLPVVIDDTTEPAARVPDKFRERQWTRLIEDQAVTKFVQRIAKLLVGSGSPDEMPLKTAPVLASSPVAAAPAKAGDTPSIAVLAFANRSASADDEYFSDGLADELLNVLAKIKGLRVVARTSSFAFKGKSDDIATIGAKLNVATLLEGSVRKSGNRVRISVQLVKVADSAHLWSETYDRTLDDIFAVQDDIAQAVVQALRVTLMGSTHDVASASSVRAEIANAAKGRTDNGEAHRLLLQARFLISRAGPTDLEKGIDYARHALAIDPAFALAWTWLARGLTFAAAFGSALVIEANEEARAAAENAIALEPDLVDAHVALVWHKYFYEWDWPGAVAAAQRALTLGPDDVGALASAAMVYTALGQNETSLTYAEHAVDLDPLNPTSWREMAQTLAAMRKLTEGEAAWRKVLELSPNSLNVRARFSILLERQGRHAEAVAMAQSEAADFGRWNALGILYALEGNIDEADKVLKLLIDNFADSAAVQIAMNYAARKDADRAFLWLDRAYAQRDSGLAFMKSSWIYESLYADPRWIAFLKKMGLQS